MPKYRITAFESWGMNVKYEIEVEDVNEAKRLVRGREAGEPLSAERNYLDEVYAFEDVRQLPPAG